MPTLEKIVIQDFRNMKLQEISFSSNVNCIWGCNGEGKTNLLDAIYYLSMTKGPSGLGDRFNFRHDGECVSGEFSLSGNYSISGDRKTRISIKVCTSGEKTVRRDDKAYTRISEHIGLLPVVMVSPRDGAMISEGGDERRKFVNSVISQMNIRYLFDLQQYNSLLQQRNKLLKTDIKDFDLLDVMDIQMSALARKISDARNEFIDELLPVVKSYYGKISGGRETIGIAYESDCLGNELIDILRNSRQKDICLKFTGAGIQRDDFIFTMEDYPIRKCGSQGQQKSFLVALKFAQYELMKKSHGFPPILLLDDLFDKLDINRVSNLLEMVSGDEFGQIFITDTDKSRILDTIGRLTENRAYFETAGGVIKRTDE